MPIKAPLPSTCPSLETIGQDIAEIIHGNLDIEIEKILADTLFVDLHEYFDSLAFVEVQLLIEEKYGFDLEIDHMNKDAKMPTKLTELAVVVQSQLQAAIAKAQKKSAEQSLAIQAQE